ncbi:retrovirus-related pol polyprotein from transposon TNT 1-94 [Tanacetum coccineum]
MYKVQTESNQTRTSQFPQDIRKLNKRVSFSTGVITTTNVNRPQLKSNQMGDRVMPNNSQGKKQEVESQLLYKWKPKSPIGNVSPNVSIPLRNASRTANILAPMTPSQLCDADLEVAFRKSTCYIRDLKGNCLLTGSRGTDLYSITLQETSTPNPICLMAKATSSQAWLWHRRLSHLNFDTINLLSKNNIVTGLPKLKFIKDHLCSSCELGKAKRKSFHTKTTPSSKRRLQLLHMDLCGPMQVESINGKKYVLVIVDDYSRYTWTHFLRSKDETPAVLIDFLTLIQRGLHAQVRTIQTDKGMKFLNKILHAYFAKEGIRHETSTARTPEQNGVVERWNRTLVEVAQTMLSAAKVPLFFWAEAIATTCFTQNRSLVIPRHEKTPYHIINSRKSFVKFFHIFGSLCYIIRDGENLDKMKEKGDACIFVGYSTQSRAYRVFNKRTRIIVETIHVNFDELPHMASDHVSSDPVPQCLTTTLEHDSLSPDPQSQENVPQEAETVKTSNELDLLFSPMFDELLNGTTLVVSKSFAVHAADAPNKRQQQHTTPSTSTTVAADSPSLNIQKTPVTTSKEPTQVPTVTANENIIQAETNKENAQVENDKFINIFSTPIQERGETSSHYVDSSNMHTFYQHHPSEHRWTKDHPLEQIHQSPRGIFINQAKYAQEILKKHGITSCDSIGTPMATKHLDVDLSGLWYPKETGVELTAFSDSDHAGCLDSRKSTSSGIQFLGGDKLVSWSSKKQDCTSMSSLEAEYHFIKEQVEKGIVELFFVGTEYQLADLFTKALSKDRFKYLVRRLGMRCLTPDELEVVAIEFA